MRHLAALPEPPGVDVLDQARVDQEPPGVRMPGEGPRGHAEEFDPGQRPGVAQQRGLAVEVLDHGVDDDGGPGWAAARAAWGQVTRIPPVMRTGVNRTGSVVLPRRKGESSTATSSRRSGSRSSSTSLPVLAMISAISWAGNGHRYSPWLKARCAPLPPWAGPGPPTPWRISGSVLAAPHLGRSPRPVRVGPHPVRSPGSLTPGAPVSTCPAKRRRKAASASLVTVTSYQRLLRRRPSVCRTVCPGRTVTARTSPP